MKVAVNRSVGLLGFRLVPEDDLVGIAQLDSVGAIAMLTLGIEQEDLHTDNQVHQLKDLGIGRARNLLILELLTNVNPVVNLLRELTTSVLGVHSQELHHGGLRGAVVLVFRHVDALLLQCISRWRVQTEQGIVEFRIEPEIAHGAMVGLTTAEFAADLDLHRKLRLGINPDQHLLTGFLLDPEALRLDLADLLLARGLTLLLRKLPQAFRLTDGHVLSGPFRFSRK